MIPCRVFLQKLQTIPQTITSPKPKISLTLNSIFYDEIKPFQTKYFCLTTKDIIGLEASIQVQQNQFFIGKIDISDAFKLALESETIQIKINGDATSNVKQINMSICLQPVAAFSRKKLAQSSQDEAKRIEKLIQENLASNCNESQNKGEISFSHRQPKQTFNQISLNNVETYYPNNTNIYTNSLLHTNTLINSKNQTINLAKDFRQPLGQTFNNISHPYENSSSFIKETHRIYNPYSMINVANPNEYNVTNQNKYKDVPLFNQTQKSVVEEAQSLESLAQQRQKILGELFGRFKGIK